MSMDGKNQEGNTDYQVKVRLQEGGTEQRTWISPAALYRSTRNHWTPDRAVWGLKLSVVYLQIKYSTNLAHQCALTFT